MKKTANLKQRLDDLRDEPELPVEIVLRLDTELHRTLQKLAAQEQLSVEAYLQKLLRSHVETALAEDKTRQDG